MNILWLAPYPFSSKKNLHPASWITSLAKLLIKNDVKLTILTVSKLISEPIKYYVFDGIKIIVLKVPNGYIDILSLFKVRINIIHKYLKSNIEMFDLIHVHGTEHQYASSLLSLKSNIPMVISIQGLIYKCKNELKEIISIRRIIWELGSVYEKNEIKKNLNFICRTNWDSGCIISINPNARIFKIWEVLRPKFYETILTHCGENIIFAGGSNILKGINRCLLVFNLLLNDFPFKKLHIIGEFCFTDFDRIKSKYHLGNLNSANVILHGMINEDEIIALYNDCYCLYHPTLIDNSPNSICEAQLVGLPVIANNTGGIPSLIQNNFTGFITNNFIEDYNILKLLANDKLLQSEIAFNAHKIAVERHSQETIISETIDVYKKLINEKYNYSL